MRFVLNNWVYQLTLIYLYQLVGRNEPFANALASVASKPTMLGAFAISYKVRHLDNNNYTVR